MNRKGVRAAAARLHDCIVMALAATMVFAGVVSLAACGSAARGTTAGTTTGATAGTAPGAAADATTDIALNAPEDTAAGIAGDDSTDSAADAATDSAAGSAADSAAGSAADSAAGSAADAVTVAGGASQPNPVAAIEMEDGGVIIAELYPDTAPNTVKSFISLANDGFYDGVIFHRVIPGFMIQGGDPDGSGRGGPGYSIKGEFTNNGFENDLKHARGVMSMARQGNQFDPPSAYNTAGSQFFIMVDDAPFLDEDYAAFGMVTAGMDVVDAIVLQPRDDFDKPLTDQTIKSIRVNTFGIDYGPPEVIAD